VEDKKANSKWRWIEGEVDTREEHIRITYGENLLPVALIALDQDKTVIVQFILLKVDMADDLNQRRLNEVQRELDFFLIELDKEEPWVYAIYHCTTASNIYSQVHWSYYPKGSKMT